MGMRTNRYHQVDAPRRSTHYAATCSICGHEELKRPVWLKDNATGQVIPVGPQCAANVLQGVTAKEVKAAARTLRAAKEAADRDAWIEWLYAQTGTRKPVLALKKMGARYMNLEQWRAAQ